MDKYRKRKMYKLREVLYLLIFSFIYIFLLVKLWKNPYLMGVFLLASVFLLLYSLYESEHIIIKEVVTESENIPLGTEDIKIVYFTDIQSDYFFTQSRKKLKRLVKLINKQNPDIILFGGDFINKARGTEVVFEELSFLENRKNMYVVLGNHDYHDYNKISKKMKELEINVLKNEGVMLGKEENSIFLAGVDDYLRGNSNVEKALLDNDGKYTILLCHNPDYIEKIPEKCREKIDLILCGHTHGGQINLFFYSPFIPSENGQKYRYGLKDYGKGKIYISSGIGGVMFPVRFMSVPEVVVLKLKQSNKIKSSRENFTVNI